MFSMSGEKGVEERRRTSMQGQFMNVCSHSAWPDGGQELSTGQDTKTIDSGVKTSNNKK